MRYSLRLGDTNVASHMPALPPALLMPVSSLRAYLEMTQSVLQLRADVYMGQSAVLAVTGCGGPLGSAAFSALLASTGLVDEQLENKSAVTPIATTKPCLTT